jgi:hypothetical protein
MKYLKLIVILFVIVLLMSGCTKYKSRYVWAIVTESGVIETTCWTGVAPATSYQARELNITIKYDGLESSKCPDDGSIMSYYTVGRKVKVKLVEGFNKEGSLVSRELVW